MPDGNDWQLELYSQAADGDINQPLTIGPFKIDTISPTATITPFNKLWVTSTQFTVAWTGQDSNPDTSLFFTLQYYGGEAITWTTWLSHSNAYSTTFSGLDDATYNFRVQAEDEAGNKSQWSTVETVRVRTNPYLLVNPLAFKWWLVYTDTTPITTILSISNEGNEPLNWQLSTSPYQSWVTVSYTAGLAPASVLLTISNPLTDTNNSLLMGQYQTIITITGQANVRCSPVSVTIQVNVVDAIIKSYLPWVTKHEY